MIEDDESQELSPSEITPETAPPFSDTDENKINAIVKTFFQEADEDLFEWINNDWPKFERPMTMQEAIAKVERTGDASDLRSILEEASRKKPRGRRKMHPAHRVEAFPIHRAASMVETVELTLRAWYPDKPIGAVRPLACRVVEALWLKYFSHMMQSEQVITADKLLNFLDRSRQNRRRLIAGAS